MTKSILDWSFARWWCKVFTLKICVKFPYLILHIYIIINISFISELVLEALRSKQKFGGDEAFSAAAPSTLDKSPHCPFLKRNHFYSFDPA